MLDALYARGEVGAQLDDAAWLRALCDVEAALAGALAAVGELAPAVAEEIVDGCARVAARGDLEPLRRAVRADATPVTGLVEVLRAEVGPEARDHVHAGATSQDIVDTALMLLVRRGLEPLLVDVRGAADAAARLAAEHRDTPMIGRTLLQQALPTTFGLLAAGWLDGLTEIQVHLHHVRDAELAVQMGGPVGGRAPEVAAVVARKLGLGEPTLGWATIRVRPALSASVLGVASGVAAKIARDVTLLSQTEVGEVAEARGGGSSAMAHKRNPVAAVSTLACCTRTPGLVATMLAAMQSELQRAAGAWQAEWGTLTELATLTGAAFAWLRECLEGLRVDGARMAANLAAASTGDGPIPTGADASVERALAAHARLSG